jgi:hypothetical protein
MNSMSHSLNVTNYQSLRRIDSTSVPGVSFWIRRVSLAHRIELLTSVRELLRRNEFLSAGSELERSEAALGSVIATRLYVEWGLARIEGITIDDAECTTALLVEKGPEDLCAEVAAAVQHELGLSEDERKNF